MRVLGVREPRMSFDMTTYARVVFSDAVASRHKVFLVGGELGVSDAAAKCLEQEFLGLNIVGTHGGFFESAERRGALLNQLIEVNPEIVVVGMGTPMQEKFLIDLWGAGWQTGLCGDHPFT